RHRGRGSRFARSEECEQRTKGQSRGREHAGGCSRALHRGQGVMAVAPPLEPSAYVKSAANGKPPIGHLEGTTTVLALRPRRCVLVPTVNENMAIEASGSDGIVEIGGI